MVVRLDILIPALSIQADLPVHKVTDALWDKLNIGGAEPRLYAPDYIIQERA